MATVKSSLVLQDKMSSTLSSITKAMRSTLNGMKAIKSENLGAHMDIASKEIMEAERQLAEFNVELQEMHDNTNNANRGLTSSITSLVGLYTVLKGAKALMDMTDTYTSNQARLKLITREGENIVDINNEIYKSAQRSRTGYYDLQASVAKLGQTASKSFSSTAEVIRFTELLNKNFVVGGASATEQASAMYQLTQAMGAGKLQGDEYRSIIENAPLLAKAIEDYMINVEHAKGSMKEWAADGLLTADVIKAALFSSAEDIEAKYAQMPLTFAQSWTLVKNSATRAFEPVMKMLSKVLQGFATFFDFLSENQYIFYLVAAGIMAIITPILLYNAYTAISTVVTNLLSTALGKLYLKYMLITVAILIVVGVLIYLWNTNDQVAYGMLFVWDSLQLGILSAALVMKSAFYGILDAMSYMKMGGLLIVSGFVDGIIEMINVLISMLNLLPGVSIDSIGTMSSFVIEESAKENQKIADRAAEIAADTQALMTKTQELNASRNQRVENRKKLGIDEAFNNGTDLSQLVGTDATGGKALKTTSNDNLLSDEDIQMLLDIATRDYQLSYQSVTPNIAITFGDVRETADVDGVMDVIAGRIEEIINGDGEISE